MIQTVLHIIFWILVFMQGVFQLLEISSVYHKVGMPLIIILLVIELMGKKRPNMPYFGIVSILTLITVLSAINNSISLFSYVYFLMYLILSYLYFIIIVNENNIRRLKKITWTIIMLYLIQIPAVIIKYFIIGQSEKGGIGTVSISGGSISTILSTFAIAYLFSLFYFKRDIKYLILIVGFFLFGIIGEKRAIIFYIPITIFLVFFIDKIMTKQFTTIQSFKLFFIIVSFYLSVRLNPSLTPDNEMWGRFDLNYVINYSKEYNQSSKRNLKEISRMEGLIYFSTYLYRQDLITFLFGEGAGELISTKYGKYGSTPVNLMLENYGVRYGGRMGFVWMYLQIGALGVFFYWLIIYKLFKFVGKNYKPNAIYLSFLVITIIYILDFFTYSYEFFKQFYLSGVYFFIAALIILDVKHGNIINRIIPDIVNKKYMDNT